MGNAETTRARRALAMVCAAAALTTTCARTASIDASAPIEAPTGQTTAGPGRGTPASPLRPWSATATPAAPQPVALSAPVAGSPYSLRLVGFQPAPPREAAANAAPPPIVVILPGSEGLSWDYVNLARRLAERGATAVAGCWFREAQISASTIPCPAAPAFIGANKAAIPAVEALVTAAQSLAARSQSPTAGRTGEPPVYLLGHSRGATMALHVAASNTLDTLGGVVASSAITTYSPGFAGMFDDMPIIDAATVGVPVLLIHPQDDSLVAWSQSAAEARALPDKLVHTWFPATGEHMVLSTRAADFVAQTLQFIEAVQPSS